MIDDLQKTSRLDPELMPRRDILGMAAMWSAASAALFALFGILRLPKAAVLSSPSKKFRVTLPETLGPSEAFVPTGRNVSVFRDAEGAFALSLVCTHLGCIIKPNDTGFECPCHGSRFDRSGKTTKGPAPRDLSWLKITGSGNQWVVDEGADVPPGTKVRS